MSIETRSGFVESADGTRIGYRRLGAGPPLMIVHGGLGTSAGWVPVAERLARDFEVVLFDRRGRGASEPGGEPHGLEREVADVRALIDLTGTGTALVGHSFGGAVAMEAARVDPRISSIVVYEPAIGVGGSISETDIDRMDELLARGEPDAALDVAIARLDAAGLVSADARTPGTRRPESVLALAPTVPRELRAVTAPGLPIERYAALDRRVLVLLGTRSPGAQQENCKRLAATLPGGRLGLLDDLGHVAHTAAPGVVAEAVRAFLSAPTTR